MTTVDTRQDRSQTVGHRAIADQTTRRLLACGIVAGLLFAGVSFLQGVTRPGFDLARQPLSLLLLGGLGWIQFINFELVGLLSIAYGIGVRRLLHPGRAGTWAPIFLYAFGAGLIVAGIFGPDPSMGYPPGAPEGTPATMSTHSAVHGVGFFLCLMSVVAGAIVFARRFAAEGSRGWAAYCIATAIASPILVALSGVMMPSGRGGVPLFGLAIVFGAWLISVAIHLRRTA